MKKNLFLFFEGLATSVIDSQVLIHCRNMKKIDVEFEIWAFACNNELYENSLKRIEDAKKLSGCEVKVFKGIKPAYPFSENINASLVKKNIEKYKLNFNLIHARTDYSAHIASLVTNNFIWDCRGDTLAEFEKDYEKSNFFLGKFYKRYKISKSIKQATKATKAVFVSNFLKDKLQYKKESYVIGCAADHKLFFFDEYLRREKRDELNLSENEKVLIYSGGMASYQMFPQTVTFFKGLDDDWKFIILTTNLHEAKKYLFDLSPNRYILRSVKFEEVNAYLNAADVGIMLREKDDLNRAASPTKYAEYSMSGLHIIYSDDIGDLDIYNKSINNKVKKENLCEFQYNSSVRYEVCQNTKKLLSKSSLVNVYKKLYEV